MTNDEIEELVGINDVDRNLLTQRVMDYVVTHFEHVEIFHRRQTSKSRLIRMSQI